MTPSILICDDSSLAREWLALSLPREWQATIYFASHGLEALTILKKQPIDWLLLDLNMPVMDGYQVLSALQKLALPVQVIVVSADTQPEACQRVMAGGAKAFFPKPVNVAAITTLLQTTLPQLARPDAVQARKAGESRLQLEPQLHDVCQEVVNVAMGQAGDLLARLLNVFVQQPIPKVSVLEVSELARLVSKQRERQTPVICQGFIGSGVAGEALLTLTHSGKQDIARLLKAQGELSRATELEFLMDLANMLVGALLKGIGRQVAMHFSQGYPMVLGQHLSVAELLQANASRWRKTLAVELRYGIAGFDISCDLLLLFTEDSLETLYTKLALLLDGAE